MAFPGRIAKAMCELLLRIANRPDHALAKDANLLLQAGDVVVVMPDGWKWSAVELAHPEWRIIKIPGVAESTFADLTDPASSAGVLKLKRAKSLNLADPKMAMLLASVKNADGSISTTAAKVTDLTGAKTIRIVPTMAKIG